MHRDGCQCVECSKARYSKRLSELPPMIIPRVEKSVAEVRAMFPPPPLLFPLLCHRCMRAHDALAECQP